MSEKDKILSLVRSRGPLLPVEISKEIDSNIIMASALLSELKSKSLIKVSNIKIGGSPLYYVKGQENKLQNYADKLHEKERKAYELLKEKKVVRDSKQEPVIRVALRQIKDFAKPLEVNHKGNTEIFWKWYLTPNEEAEKIIREKIGAEKTGKIETVKTEKKENSNQEPKKEEKKSEPKEEKKEKRREEQNKEEKEEPNKKQETKKEKKQEEKGEFQQEVEKFFEKNNISIVEKDVVRKTSEIDLIVEVPSPVGNLKYFCKAKSKKRVNDGDLSSAFIQSQSKKMPCMFLMKGKLTKKAEEMLESEFKGMSVKKI